jgi:hypothetical protein
VARAKPSKVNVKKIPALTYSLVFVLVFEVLLSVWCFVHFGAGTSRIAVDRFQPYGAETMMVITALTATFAWFAIDRHRWALEGTLIGLGGSLLWLRLSPLNMEGLKGSKDLEVFPAWPVNAMQGITVIAAIVLVILALQEAASFSAGITRRDQADRVTWQGGALLGAGALLAAYTYTSLPTPVGYAFAYMAAAFGIAIAARGLLAQQSFR